MIVILDYGMGNVKSILNMFKKINVDAIITSDIEIIKKADKYILPGVGSFDHGMQQLKDTTFFLTLQEQVLKYKKPILGICLGMQLLCNSSEEGNEKGLGWINAYVIKFTPKGTHNQPIPHMGWNYINPKNTPLFQNLDQTSKFYFVHSYHVTCKDVNNTLATSSYGDQFTSSIHLENIYGVQFHPEKSHKFGMKLLQNFSDL